LFPSRKLTYKDTMFFNVEKGFFIQGGDVIRNDGTGGETIFGPRIGEESYCLKFEKPYRVAMAGNGRHSVNSQFLITLKEAPVLDNYHCIFGDVVDGFHVLNEIERLTSNGLKEFQYLYISDCGPNYEGKVQSKKHMHTH
jgi:cyclophilin family peptidyl-prolyl cis-trans isomerase